MMKKKCTWMILMCAICVLLSACSAGNRQDTFLNWKEDAAPIAALKEYVGKVTDEKSEYYIPIEDRIAVFDLEKKTMTARISDLDEALCMEEIESCELYNGRLLCNTSAGSVFTIREDLLP